MSYESSAKAAGVAMVILIVAFLLMALLSGCGDPIPNDTYKCGDIVYLKPDTICAVVTDNMSMSGKYVDVSYRDATGENHELRVQAETLFENFTNKQIRR